MWRKQHGQKIEEGRNHCTRGAQRLAARLQVEGRGSRLVPEGAMLGTHLAAAEKPRGKLWGWGRTETKAMEKWLMAAGGSREQDAIQECTEQCRDEDSTLMCSQWVLVVTKCKRGCQESWDWSWESLEREQMINTGAVVLNAVVNEGALCKGSCHPP